MALVLHVIMKCGGDIGLLMLLQCLAGGLGVYYLCRSILAFSLSNKTHASWCSVLIFVFLISPLTPLAAYLMTFWKDAWCAIIFTWIVMLALTLYRKGEEYPPGRFYLLYGIFGFLLALAPLTRYNAIFVLPSCLITAWFILYSRRKTGLTKSVFLSLIPLILFLGEHRLQYLVFPIEETHPEQQVMALDLVGIMVLEPELGEEFPFTRQHLTKHYKTAYVFGAVNRLYWRPPLAVDDSYKYCETMVQEYKRAISKYPGIWLKVKLRAFWALVDPYHTTYWFHIGITNNQRGLAQNQFFQPLRALYEKALKWVEKNRFSRLISGVHLVWIVINLAALSVVWALFYKRRDNIFFLWGVLLTIPFLYYASYLAATTAWDFRLMYPATLLVQTIMYNFLIIGYVKHKQGKRF